MKRKRPVWVWVISIFYVFGLAFSVFSIYLLESGSISLDETTSDYFESLGLLDWALAIVGIGLSATAALTFFLLKKIAVNLFLAELILTVLNYAYSTFATSYLDIISVPSMIGSMLGFGISVIIYFYARALRNKSILT